MTQTVKLAVIEHESEIIGFAEASLAVYAEAIRFVKSIKTIANHIAKMLMVVLALALALFGIPILLILLGLLAVVLLYSLTLFNFKKKDAVAYYLTLERKDAIEVHVRLKKIIRKLDSLKSSDLLFTTPVVGRLMKAYYNDLNEVEVVLRTKAYPNYNVRPQNFHAHDPASPWQRDTSDLIRV